VFIMQFNRREFVIAGAAAAAAWARLDPFAPAACAAAPAAPEATLDVGAAADYAHDGAFDKFAKSNRVMLIRKGDRLYATTATCTHKDCVVKHVQGEIRCPCHGSRFDLDGDVTKGPAKSPLPRLAIATKRRRPIVVDPSQKFGPGQWDDPKSFVKIAGARSVDGASLSDTAKISHGTPPTCDRPLLHATNVETPRTIFESASFYARDCCATSSIPRTRMSRKDRTAVRSIARGRRETSITRAVVRRRASAAAGESPVAADDRPSGT
jgi:nitrite reductase/ring-hydroxylating ferredoxin subunit